MVSMRIEARKTIVFNVGEESGMKLYQFAQSLNLSEFVRSKLAEEMQKREQEVAKKAIR